MTASVTKDLEDIKNLINVGKYREAIEKLEKNIEEEEHNISDEIRVLILLSTCYARLGMFEVEENYSERSCQISSMASKLSKKAESLQLIAEAKALYLSTYRVKQIFNPKLYLDEVKLLDETYKEIKNKGQSLPEEVEARILLALSNHSRAMMLSSKDYVWDHNETLDFLEEGLELIQESENKDLMFLLLLAKAYLYSRINEYDKSIEIFEESVKLAKDICNDYFRSLFLYEIGGLYWAKGEYKLQFDYLMKTLGIREKQENKRGIGQVYNRLGIYYLEIGDRKNALEYFQKAHDIVSEGGIKEKHFYYLNNLGALHADMGNDDEALQCWRTAYRTNKNLGNMEYAYTNLANISTIHIRRGELDKALELLEEVLDYYKIVNNKREMSGILSSIGAVYRRKKMFKQAYEYKKDYLYNLQELEVKPVIAYALFDLISLALEFEKKDIAEKYYNVLVEITQKIEYKPYKDLSLIAEALMLKTSEDSRKRVQAELILDQLMQEDLHHSVHIQVLFNLCDLLLKELKETSDTKILAKLKKNLNKLIEIGSKNDNPYLSIEILWLKSQLSLLDMNSKEAKEILTEAQQLAEEKGFNNLALKVIKAKEQLLEQTIQLEELEVETNLISRRMEILEVENGFDEIRSSDRFQFKQQI